MIKRKGVEGNRERNVSDNNYLEVVFSKFINISNIRIKFFLDIICF